MISWSVFAAKHEISFSLISEKARGFSCSNYLFSCAESRSLMEIILLGDSQIEKNLVSYVRHANEAGYTSAHPLTYGKAGSGTHHSFHGNDAYSLDHLQHTLLLER
jgi:hypothetical protein